jgi:hypothetical protein
LRGQLSEGLGGVELSGPGYSGRPLAQKLGIRAGDRVAVVGDPGHAASLLEPLPPDVELTTDLTGAGVVLFFTTEREALAEAIDALGSATFPDGSCWVAWPKRGSGIQSSVTEDVVREVALPLGLVDNKVCAIDERWSGLRLVWRREVRRASRRTA